MTPEFKSERHERLFDDVLGHLERLGYRGGFLPRSYRFVDWFHPDNPLREVPAAAFWTTPPSYETASFAILVPNGLCGRDLVTAHRALGAPLAFEVRENSVVSWVVGKDAHRTVEQDTIAPEALDRLFHDHERDWSRDGIVRLKNLSVAGALQPQQLDLFVDTGLIPALEGEIRRKLNAQLIQVLAAARETYANRHRRPPDGHQLFRLVFRFLAAKVLHDRGQAPFSTFDSQDAPAILASIEDHYRDVSTRPVLSDVPTQRAVCDQFWNRVNFSNLSVEALAYIYEETLVTDEARRRQGTHSTPHSVARFIVHQLPFGRLTDGAAKWILDPFAGHGIFLVAALQRLREQLALANVEPRERHHFFKRRLRGFDVDAFAVEVAKLCLMLADFPNGNGWRVEEADSFSSPDVRRALNRTGVLLCNPPFGEFTSRERSSYRTTAEKPVAFLKTALRHLPRGAMLGLVLPRQIIDGHDYQEVRETLARRFDELDVVALPDRVFHKSTIETAILIGRQPRIGNGTAVTVAYAQVADRDRANFLAEYKVTSRETERKSIPDATRNLAVILAEVRRRLERFDTVGDVARVNRGVEWTAPSAAHVSRSPRPGFRPGIYKMDRDLSPFQPPPTAYLSTRTEARRRGDFDAPWDNPKVIANAARVSRGPWRLAAFADDTGLMCSQSFHAVWPAADDWTPRCLAAVLNGPVANAFVVAHEAGRHVTVETVRRIPIPRLSRSEKVEIDKLVTRYTRLIEDRADTGECVRALLEIDAAVLRGYQLQPRLERQLLDLFAVGGRSTPFPFPPYFPPSFEPYIPLWMYLSEDYQKSNATHLLSVLPTITDEALLDALREVQ